MKLFTLRELELKLFKVAEIGIEGFQMTGIGIDQLELDPTLATIWLYAVCILQLFSHTYNYDSVIICLCLF